MNGIETKIIMKPLTFLDNNVNGNTSNVEVSDNINENNVEEQVTTIDK